MTIRVIRKFSTAAGDAVPLPTTAGDAVSPSRKDGLRRVSDGFVPASESAQFRRRPILNINTFEIPEGKLEVTWRVDGGRPRIENVRFSTNHENSGRAVREVFLPARFEFSGQDRKLKIDISLPSWLDGSGVETVVSRDLYFYDGQWHLNPSRSYRGRFTGSFAASFFERQPDSQKTSLSPALSAPPVLTSVSVPRESGEKEMTGPRKHGGGISSRKKFKIKSKQQDQVDETSQRLEFSIPDYNLNFVLQSKRRGKIIEWEKSNIHLYEGQHKISVNKKNGSQKIHFEVEWDRRDTRIKLRLYPGALLSWNGKEWVINPHALEQIAASIAEQIEFSENNLISRAEEILSQISQAQEQIRILHSRAIGTKILVPFLDWGEIDKKIGTLEAEWLEKESVLRTALNEYVHHRSHAQEELSLRSAQKKDEKESIQKELQANESALAVILTEMSEIESAYSESDSEEDFTRYAEASSAQENLFKSRKSLEEKLFSVKKDIVDLEQNGQQRIAEKKSALRVLLLEIIKKTNSEFVGVTQKCESIEAAFKTMVALSLADRDKLLYSLRSRAALAPGGTGRDRGYAARVEALKQKALKTKERLWAHIGRSSRAFDCYVNAGAVESRLRGKIPLMPRSAYMHMAETKCPNGAIMHTLHQPQEHSEGSQILGCCETAQDEKGNGWICLHTEKGRRIFLIFSDTENLGQRYSSAPISYNKERLEEKPANQSKGELLAEIPEADVPDEVKKYFSKEVKMSPQGIVLPESRFSDWAKSPLFRQNNCFGTITTANQQSAGVACRVLLSPNCKPARGIAFPADFTQVFYYVEETKTWWREGFLSLRATLIKVEEEKVPIAVIFAYSAGIHDLTVYEISTATQIDASGCSRSTEFQREGELVQLIQEKKGINFDWKTSLASTGFSQAGMEKPEVICNFVMKNGKKIPVTKLTRSLPYGHNMVDFCMIPGDPEEKIIWLQPSRETPVLIEITDNGMLREKYKIVPFERILTEIEKTITDAGVLKKFQDGDRVVRLTAQRKFLLQDPLVLSDFCFAAQMEEGGLSVDMISFMVTENGLQILYLATLAGDRLFRLEWNNSQDCLYELHDHCTLSAGTTKKLAEIFGPDNRFRNFLRTVPEPTISHQVTRPFVDPKIGVALTQSSRDIPPLAPPPSISQSNPKREVSVLPPDDASGDSVDEMTGTPPNGETDPQSPVGYNAPAPSVLTPMSMMRR